MVNKTDYSSLELYITSIEKRREIVREYNNQIEERKNRIFDWVNYVYGGKKIKLTNIDGTDFENDKIYVMYYFDLRIENGNLDVFVELYETDKIKYSAYKVSGFLIKRMVVID